MHDPERVAALEADLTGAGGTALPNGRTYVRRELADGVGVRPDGLDALLIDPDRARVVAGAAEAGDPHLEHRLVGFALPMLLGALGDIALHGSAIGADHGGYVLCGPSGRGKTTTSLALAQQGAALLSDDAVVLRPGVDLVWPGPLGSRVLRPDGGKDVVVRPMGTAPFPLRALVILEPRGAGPLLRRLAPPDGFVAMLAHLCVLTEAGHARMFHALADLVRRVPVVAASLPDDRAALPSNAQRLLEALADVD